MVTTILTAGLLHQDQNPAADALIITDGYISWIGEAENAPVMSALAANEVARVDHPGALVAPLPVDMRLAGSVRAVASGYFAPMDNGDSAAATVISGRELADLTGVRRDEAAGELAAIVDEPSAVQVKSSAELEDVTAALNAHVATGGRLGPLWLHIAPGVAFGLTHWRHLARPIPLVIDADAGLVGVEPAALVAAGAVLALAADEPWRAYRAAVTHSLDPMSGRSAFVALTRTPRRILGSQPSGRLAVGEPAHLGVWSADSYIVQVPRIEGRLGGWSTDARARSAMLPEVGSDLPLPEPLDILHLGYSVI